MRCHAMPDPDRRLAFFRFSKVQYKSVLVPRVPQRKRSLWIMFPYAKILPLQPASVLHEGYL